MELGILPVIPRALAFVRRAMERDSAVVMLDESDVVPGEEVLTFRAHTHFAQRPPVFQGIASAKEPEFATGSFRQ